MSTDAVARPRAPFVTTLRSRPGTLRLAAPGQPLLTVRVEMPEVWDIIRVEVSPDETVARFKARALQALFPQAEFPEDFVLKLRGWELVDEQASLAESGTLDGSIFILTHRRRRPVR